MAALTLSRGVLITFEGGEGAGKSTQIGRLAERLSGELGIAADRILRVREPGGSQLVEDLIRPSLAAGKVVLCDRFADSTVAYQGGGRGLPAALVDSVNRLACGEIRPDLTVLLDLDPALGLARASARDSGKADRLESLDLAFHRRVREAYHALAAAEPARFLVLDATRPPAEVAEAIWHEVRRRLA